MANPRASFAGSVKGVWLMPTLRGTGVSVSTSARVFIGGASPDTETEVSRNVYTVPGRAAKVSQRGTVHLSEGTITGALFGFEGLTADQWLVRLSNLVEQQHLYVVALVSARYNFPIELGSYSKAPAQIAGRAWEVEVEFREVS